MAKKADLLAEASKLGLEVSEKNTIAEIEAAIANAAEASTPTAEEAVVDAEAEAAVAEKEETFAKAGKRSAKAAAEAEAKAEKELRKEAGDTTPQDGSEEVVKKGPKPVTRPVLERRGKNYRKVAEKVDAAKLYSLEEAVKIAAQVGYPVLVRPSYVLGGRAMFICYREESLRTAIRRALEAFPDRPVLIDHFLENAYEFVFEASTTSFILF